MVDRWGHRMGERGWLFFDRSISLTSRNRSRVVRRDLLVAISATPPTGSAARRDGARSTPVLGQHLTLRSPAADELTPPEARRILSSANLLDTFKNKKERTMERKEQERVGCNQGRFSERR